MPKFLKPNGRKPAHAPDHGASRHVGVDFNFPAIARGDSDVELFDGTVVSLKWDHFEPRTNGYTWRGKVKGRANSIAVISTIGGNAVSGTIDFGPNDRYQIQTQADGSTLLRQIDESLFPPDHPPGGPKVRP